MFPRPHLTQWPSAAAPTLALLTLSEGARGGGLLEGKVMRWRGGERVKTGMVVLVLLKCAWSDGKVRVRFLPVLYTILRGEGASRLLPLRHGICVSREARAMNQMTPCLAHPAPPAPP
ncbi:hypothetical protein E2C01_093759 [Portunus trituberculatus]|uniref:Uncharacterized protein n=1 Tax=Portunus trituberculatus TaxID=210409 RepID=A0A5B7JNJ9_PORTR|nr:hypothetical protein [Portunus trituberculatus]